MKKTEFLGALSNKDVIERECQFLSNVRYLLQNQTPGPVVEALLEDLSDSSFTVLSRPEYEQLKREPEAVATSFKHMLDDVRTQRTKSDARLAEAMTHIEKGVCGALDIVRDATKPLSRKSGARTRRNRELKQARAYLEKAREAMSGLMGPVGMSPEPKR